MDYSNANMQQPQCKMVTMKLTTLIDAANLQQPTNVDCRFHNKDYTVQVTPQSIYHSHKTKQKRQSQPAKDAAVQCSSLQEQVE